MPRKNHKVKF